MNLWQDRAYTAIQETNSLPSITDRWSPRRPGDSAVEQAKLLIGQIPSSSKFDFDPVIEPTIEGGLIIEWSQGSRELCFTITPAGRITVLQANEPNYIEGDLNFSDLEKLFSWLAEG